MEHIQRELDIIKAQKADCHAALWASIRERDALQAQLAAARERMAKLEAIAAQLASTEYILQNMSEADLRSTLHAAAMHAKRVLAD